MQRWLFFTFCFLLHCCLQAQLIDLRQTELSLWTVGPRSSNDPGLLKARAVISFKALSASPHVTLLAAGGSIRQIRARQGRDKGDIAFTHLGETLELKMAVIQGRDYTIAIDYDLDLNAEWIQAYIQKSDDLLAFNPFNTLARGAMGTAGSFYPAVEGDASQLLLNLTLDATRTCTFPGELQFETAIEGNHRSQFWKSKEPILPEAFYLIIGNFQEFDAQDLEEEFELSAIELRKVRVFRGKANMMPAARFIGLETAALTDSQYAYVDSLSSFPKPGFFIHGDEAELRMDPRELSRRKTLLLYTNNNDTSKVSELLWNMMVEEKGQAWANNLIEAKWRGLEELKTWESQKVIRYRLQRWQSANPDLFSVFDSSEIDSLIVQPMVASGKFPELSIGYRYIAGDTALWVNYSQDTAKTNPYSLPIKVSWHSQDGMFEEVGRLNAIDGRVKVMTDRIPDFAEVSFGQFFPGRWEDQKPDTYLLYQLSKAESTEARKSALKGLLATANPNLFSTALGIGMRDVEPDIRLMALQRSESLNYSAQQKLKSSLKALTEDESEEVRVLAKVLVQKYYDGK